MATFPALLILGFMLVVYGAALAVLVGATIIIWMEVLDEFRRRRRLKRLEREVK